MVCTGCVDTSLYHSVSFWIHGGTSGGQSMHKGKFKENSRKIQEKFKKNQRKFKNATKKEKEKKMSGDGVHWVCEYLSLSPSLSLYHSVSFWIHGGTSGAK
jgi:hypothetical protein